MPATDLGQVDVELGGHLPAAVDGRVIENRRTDEQADIRSEVPIGTAAHRTEGVFARLIIGGKDQAVVEDCALFVLLGEHSMVKRNHPAEVVNCCGVAAPEQRLRDKRVLVGDEVRTDREASDMGNALADYAVDDVIVNPRLTEGVPGEGIIKVLPHIVSAEFNRRLPLEEGALRRAELAIEEPRVSEGGEVIDADFHLDLLERQNADGRQREVRGELT